MSREGGVHLSTRSPRQASGLRECRRRLRVALAAFIVLDPAAAIGSCKEVVESLCKLILEGSGVEFPPSEDLPALYRRVADLLKLKAESVPASAKGSKPRSET